jgi:23S rRNA (guanosine2251-2'-O)-methyltransferase
MKATKGKYWIYGKHAVIAALNNPRRQVFELLITQPNHGLVKKSAVKFKISSPDEISRQIKQNSAVHQGIAAYVSTIDQPLLSDVVEKCMRHPRSVILALDQITDPQNIGAIMRSAAAFSADAIILPKHNSPDESASIAKTSSGALEILPLIHVSNLANSLTYLKKQGYWVIGLDGEADAPVSEIKKYEKAVIVLGGEGSGMRKLTNELCDLTLRIPISPGIESLNVSNAAAIALFAGL